MQKIENLLERIAAALERTADALEIIAHSSALKEGEGSLDGSLNQIKKAVQLCAQTSEAAAGIESIGHCERTAEEISYGLSDVSSEETVKAAEEPIDLNAVQDTFSELSGISASGSLDISVSESADGSELQALQIKKENVCGSADTASAEVKKAAEEQNEFVIRSAEDWSLWNEEDKLFFEMPSEDTRRFAAEYPYLTSFFKKRSIAIKEIFKPLIPLELDNLLEKTAFFMGRKYNNAAPLLNIIKANLNTRREICLDMAVFNKEIRHDILTLGKCFYQAAFFDNFRYQDYPDYKLYLHVSSMGAVHNFFSGFWFERYIAQEAEHAVREAAAEFNVPLDDFEIMRNVKIVFKNMQRERDIMLNFAGQQYWFECKSGDNYIDSVPVYEKFSENFDFNSKNCFLVFLGAENCFHSSANSGMCICSSFNFAKDFAALLRENLTKNK